MERFWSKVNKGDTCWNWTGYHLKGRGRFSFNGKAEYAPRVAWYLEHSVWPNQYVLHTCDNPSCVNPDHLFLGTHLDNLKDMYQKNRHTKGETVGVHKLTEEEVLSIRASQDKQKDLASRYHVCCGTISMIISRKIWRHI